MRDALGSAVTRTGLLGERLGQRKGNQELSKTSTALRRFGVGVLSAATISSGLVAFAGSASAATSDITALSIAPTAAATSTGENVCQLYTITATEANSATTGEVTVTLQPTGGVDTEFCSGTPHNYVTGGTPSGTAQALPYNPGAGNGTADSATFTLDGTNKATFGVKEAAAAAGQASITVSPYNGTSTTPASGAPTAQALQTFITASAQNDIVTALSATPSTQNATIGQTVPFTVTVKNGSSNAVQGAYVYYSIKSSQGNSTGSDNVACSGNPTDQNGTVTCNIAAPPTTGVQSGPYTVTFKVPQNTAGGVLASAAIPPANAGPTTTATLTTSNQAPAGSIVNVDCGGTNTKRVSSNVCFEPTSARTETFKATVSGPANAQGVRSPVAGVVVSFATINSPSNCNGTNPAGAGATPNCPNPGTEKATIPDCTTGADGTCTSTMTIDAAPVDGDQFEVRATIQTGPGTGVPTPVSSNCCSSNQHDAYVIFTDRAIASAASNISLTAQSASQTTGHTDVVTAKLTDPFGNAANDQQQVTFTITGAGTFQGGSTQQVVFADQNGIAQATVVSGAAGTSHVTASLNPIQSNCEQNADPSIGAKAGNCSASTDIAWTKSTTSHRVVVNLHLSCFSPKRHVVKCVGQLNRPISGVTVVFRNAAGTVVGRDVTNAAGKAVMKLRGLKSHKTHRYHAHAKKSAKTFGADSNVAKVRVS